MKAIILGSEHDVEVRPCWVDGRYVRFDGVGRLAILVEDINPVANQGLVVDGDNLLSVHWTNESGPHDPDRCWLTIMIRPSDFSKQDKAEVEMFVAGVI